MSGPEVVIGLVAGGAGLLSLSIQLVESATKLKRIYHAARDAPATITRLIFDLETMAMALQQMERHRQEGMSTDALLARCILACQRSTADVRLLVDKMEGCMTRHARIGGKMYSAFKQPDIRDLLDGLENAKSSLNLAYTIYLAEEQRRRAEEQWRRDQAHTDILAIQTTKLNDLQRYILVSSAGLSPRSISISETAPGPRSHHNWLLSTPLEPTASKAAPAGSQGGSSAENGPYLEKPGAGSTFPRRHTGTKKGSTRYHVLLRLPTWICRRVYDISFIQLQQGWDLPLRTYNVVPDDSPIVRCCFEGDLAGVRRLIDSGEATLLDVTDNPFKSHLLGTIGPWRTLPEIAAYFGQVDIYQYLLGQGITWPDHGAMLSKTLGALGWGYPANCRQSENFDELYHTCTTHPEFDADIKNGLRYRWLQLCSNPTMFNYTLQSQPLAFELQSLPARFEIASRLDDIGAASFSRLIGLQPSDRDITSLCNSSGATILHVVARHLHRLSYSIHVDQLDLPQELEGWLNFGVNVLKNGANPSAVAHMELEPWLLDGDAPLKDKMFSPWPHDDSCGGRHVTPLLECLRMHSGDWSPGNLERVLRNLRGWAEMLQRAGIDLCEYGSREHRIWRALGVESVDQNFSDSRTLPELKVAGLVFGANPEDWSLIVFRCRSVNLYRLQAPPGAFISQSLVPRTVAWLPTQAESDEGPWTLVAAERRVIFSGRIALPTRPSDEPFVQLVEGCQDDAGVIMLMQYRASRRRTASKRSCSQPACLNRREVAFCRVGTSYEHSWLAKYHLCPRDCTWNTGCIASAQEWYDDYDILHDKRGVPERIFHTRSCAKGVHSGQRSLQQSERWQQHSFLAELTLCQDHAVLTGRSEIHFWHCPWPQGCRDIRVDQLNVPEDLSAYHPQRRHFERFTDDAQ